MWHAALDGVNLRQRAVFVVLSLDDENAGSGSSPRQFSMFQSRNSGSSQISFQPQNVSSTWSW